MLLIGAAHRRRRRARTQVINTEEPGVDVAARVREITGGAGAWGAVDPVGGATTAVLSAAVRDGGAVLVYGALAGLEFTGSVVHTLFRGVRIHGYWVTPRLAAKPPAARRAVVAEALSLMRTGVFAPHSGRRFPLAQARDAVVDSVRPGRASDGKTLLVTPAACHVPPAKEEL
jgi:NADPH:quinone reductase-like Zn-dependent oxidoreductase